MIAVKRLHKEDGGKCYYCNCQTHVPKVKGHGAKKRIITRPTNGTREHLIPQSDGGTNNRINIKLACYQCNSLRGTMNAVTWKIIASSPSARRGYIKMKQDLKFLKGKEKREMHLERLAAEIIEETAGIIVRHHTYALPYFTKVFGENVQNA